MPSPDIRIFPLPQAPESLAEAVSLMECLDPISLIYQWPMEKWREPAQVRLGHAENALHLLATLNDSKVISLASGPNQRTWLLGDAFEMFFQAMGTTESGVPILDYTELHVAPSGHRLQLRFPSEAFFQASKEREAFEEFLLRDPTFRSQAEPVEGGWRLWAAIDAEFIAGRPGPLVGQAWRFSFCRYDYDAVPGDPVLSSTSDHAILDFHRIADWGRMRFDG